MKNERVLFAETGQVLARAEKVADHWEVTRPLGGVKINGMVRDPEIPYTVYMGTQSDGVLISRDAGKS